MCQEITVFVDPETGFGQDAQLNEVGLQQVIDLRATYASSSIIRDLAHYRDPRLTLLGR